MPAITANATSPIQSEIHRLRLEPVFVGGAVIVSTIGFPFWRLHGVPCTPPLNVPCACPEILLRTDGGGRRPLAVLGALPANSQQTLRKVSYL